MQELARSALNLLIRISRPRRGSLALVLLHAWAWLEKLFWGPEAGQQARKEKKLFRPQKVLFSIARGRSAGKEGKTTFQAPKSFIFYRQRPASWVDGCRSSRIQSCSRRALHLCDNVKDVTTQAQEVQRPIRLRFKNPCKRPWIVEKTFRKLKSFFPSGWTLERRPTSYFLPSN